jgi:hypothetical protein
VNGENGSGAPAPIVSEILRAFDTNVLMLSGYLVDAEKGGFWSSW